MERPGCEHGIVFDGFPRNVAQADYLNRLLKDKGQTLVHVFELKVADDVLVKRITGRRMH